MTEQNNVVCRLDLAVTRCRLMDIDSLKELASYGLRIKKETTVNQATKDAIRPHYAKRLTQLTELRNSGQKKTH